MKKIITFLFLASVFSIYSQGDNCATALNLGTLPTPAGCNSATPGIGNPATHGGTNVGATAANPYVSIIDCGTGTADMASPAIDVWYSFVASGPTVVISFSNITGSFGTPQIGLYTGSCTSLTPTGCDVDGSPGTFTGIVSGQTYYIQVSGSTSTGTGSFDISVRNNQECGDCLSQSSLVATPPPVNGAYYPGQTVTFCYTIFTYNQLNTNWLHGVQISYGDGWNMISQTPPPGCDGNGAWSYIASGTNIPAGFGPGFYYNSDLGCTTCDPNDPEDNFGDANASNCDLQFCWTMQVDNACTSPISSLNVTVNTSGDGESGSWSNLSCQNDSQTSLDPNMTCCLPPIMSSTPTSCSNSSDGTATAQATGNVSPWDFYWYNSNGALVGSTMNTTNLNVLPSIPAGTYTVVVVDNANCSVASTVTVTSSPGATVTVPTNITICNGVTVNGTNFTSTGFQTASYTWTNSNTSIGIPASGTGNISSFTATNTGLTPITATITVTPYSGPDPATSCSGAPSSYIITVNPAPQVTISAAPSTNICLGQSVTLTGAYTPQPVASQQTFQNLNVSPQLTTTPTNVSTTSSGITPLDLTANQIVSACFTIRHDDFAELDRLRLIVGGITYTSQTPAPAGEIHEPSLLTLLNQIKATPPGTGNPTPPVTATFCIPDALLTIIENGTTPSNTTWTISIRDAQNGGDKGVILGWVVIINDYPQLNYAWSSTNNSSITTSPLSSTTTGGNLILNATPTSTTTYTLTVTDETQCSGTANITINVGNVTVSPPSSNPILCANTPISPAITFTTAGATGIGAATNLPTGVTASFLNNIITVSGTPTNSGTFNYTIPVTGGCTALNATGTITVNPVNTVTAASSNPTLCVNTALSPSITFTTTGASGIGSAIGLPTGLTASWFGNTITVSGTPTASGTFNYSIPLTGGCGTISATGTITVVALPIITLTPDDPNTCNALDGSILVSGTGNGTITWTGPSSGNAPNTPLNYTIPTLGAGTYSVYFTNASGCQSATVQTSLANPGAPEINIISDVTNCGNSYTLPAVPFVPGTENNPQYYTGPNGTGTVVAVGTVYNAPTNITLYAYDASVNGACSDEEPFVITINQIPSVNTLTDVSGCPGSTINPSDFSSTPAGATFAWTNDNIGIGIPSFGNGQIATFNAPANTSNANVVGTVSVTPTLNGCTGSTSTFTITILPTPTINTISNVSGCPGSSVDPADFESVPSGANFSWNNSNSNIGLIGSGIGQILPFNLISNNTSVPITGTITATAILNGCESSPLSFTISINPTPVITLGATDPSSCNGTDGSILVNSGTTGSLSWTGAVNGTSNMNTNFIIPNLPSGTYNVSFINASTGCQSSIEQTTLNNPGTPILNQIADTAQCGGLYTLLEITGSTLFDPQYYLQPNGEGGIIDVGTIFGPDTTITLYAFDANGTCTSQESFTISVTSIPEINNPGPQTACDNFTLNTASGSNIFSPTYWTETGGQGTQLNVGDVISSSSTIYIFDQNGACSNEESFPITIISTPAITNPGNQTACATYSLPTIVGNDLSGSEGYFNNSQTLGGMPISGAITSSQTVYIYDANGACSDEESFVVTINSLPTASISGGDTYCQGDAVADIVTSISGTANFTLNYTLDGAAQTESGTTTSLSLGNAAGTYVLVSITDANCTNSNLSSTQTIVVNSIPNAPIAGTDTLYCANASPVSLSAQGSGSFIWYSDLALTNVIGNNATLTPSMNVGTTNYYVTETINGCEGPAALVVVEVENCGVIVPTAFTPDGDQTNDTWILDNIDQIYPNNVVSIYNRWGNIIYQSKSGQYEANPWDGKYNNESMPVGSYYFIIEYNDDFTDSKTGIVSILK